MKNIVVLPILRQVARERVRVPLQPVTMAYYIMVLFSSGSFCTVYIAVH